MWIAAGAGIGFVICTFAEKMQIREPRERIATPVLRHWFAMTETRWHCAVSVGLNRTP